MRDHFPKENGRFSEKTVKQKCQDGIFETANRSSVFVGLKDQQRDELQLKE